MLEVDSRRAAELAEALGKGVLDRLATQLSGAPNRRAGARLGEPLLRRLAEGAENLTGAELRRLASEVGKDVLLDLGRNLTPEQIARVLRAPGAGTDGLRLIHELQAQEAAGSLRGLTDWVDFSLDRAGEDIGNLMSELREAQRLIAANPGKVIRSAPTSTRPGVRAHRASACATSTSPSRGGAAGASGASK